MMRLFVLLFAAAAFAQSPDEILAHAREVVSQHILQLPKYSCTAQIDRTYLRVTRGEAASCDTILGNRNRGRYATKPTATDRLRLDVEIADGGYELFTWPGAHFEGARIEDLAAGGPIGTGSFGAFLIDVFSNQGAEFRPESMTQLDGKRAMEYRFRVPLDASHYKVGAGGAYRFVAYDGHVWIDPASFELRRIEVRTAELPAGTGSCEATTRVDLKRIEIGKAEYLAPSTSVLGVVGRYGADSESVTTYSACHEFRGESTVTFGDSIPDTSPAPATLQAQIRSLPPGLPVLLTFETPIDTDSTAAGDPVVARVFQPVLEPLTHKVFLPAGARIEGRVVHMERHIEGGDYFILSVVFDAPHLIADHAGPFALGDKATPCWESRTQIESKSRPLNGGTFVLPSHGSRYVMPQGCVSEWLAAK